MLEGELAQCTVHHQTQSLNCNLAQQDPTAITQSNEELEMEVQSKQCRYATHLLHCVDDVGLLRSSEIGEELRNELHFKFTIRVQLIKLLPSIHRRQN